ncbi:MAG: hypothetical protein HOO96_27940 [Polyangiaceae bacterium]|nr:hypothetical protein [Polyangiaceae bacterium]
MSVEKRVEDGTEGLVRTVDDLADGPYRPRPPTSDPVLQALLERGRDKLEARTKAAARAEAEALAALEAKAEAARQSGDQAFSVELGRHLRPVRASRFAALMRLSHAIVPFAPFVLLAANHLLAHDGHVGCTIGELLLAFLGLGLAGWFAYQVARFPRWIAELVVEAFFLRATKEEVDAERAWVGELPFALEGYEARCGRPTKGWTVQLYFRADAPDIELVTAAFAAIDAQVGASSSPLRVALPETDAPCSFVHRMVDDVLRVLHRTAPVERAVLCGA